METIKSLNFIEEVETKNSVDNVVGELSKHIAGLQLSASESAFYKEEHAKLSNLYHTMKSEHANLEKNLKSKADEASLLQTKLNESAGQVKALQSDVENLENAGDTALAAILNAKSALSEKEKEIISLKADLASVERSLQEDVESWKIQTLELNAKIRTKETEAQNQITRLQSEVQNLNKSQNQLVTENQDLKAQVGQLFYASTEVKNVNERLTILQSQKTDLEMALQKSTAESKNLFQEVYNVRTQMALLETRRKILKTLRQRSKSFYKSVIRNLQIENSDLQAKITELQIELKSQSQMTEKIQLESREIITKTFQNYEEKMSGLKETYEHQIEEMQKRFDFELSNLNMKLSEVISERGANSDQQKNEVTTLSLEFQKRIGTLLEQQEQMRSSHSDELSKIKFQFEAKIDRQQMQIAEAQQRLEFVSTDMQSKLKAVKTELANERYSNEILKKQLEEKSTYVAGQGSQFDSLLKDHNALLAKYETETFEYSKVNEELRRVNLEKAEEIKALKNQLQEKSRQMVRLELVVDELKNKASSDASA